MSFYKKAVDKVFKEVAITIQHECVQTLSYVIYEHGVKQKVAGVLQDITENNIRLENAVIDGIKEVLHEKLNREEIKQRLETGNVNAYIGRVYNEILDTYAPEYWRERSD